MHESYYPSVPPAAAHAETMETWDASEFIRVLLEKLWLIVLFAVVGFFVTYGYLAREAPLYQARGSLRVEPPAQASSTSLIEAEPNLSTTEEMNTLVQSLVRPSFLLSVANDPVLQGDLSLFPPKPDGTVYTDEEKIRTLMGCVKVTLLKGTLLIDVSAIHTQPATAQRVCAAMLTNFVKERMENKTDTEQETYQFLLSEADRLGVALNAEERQIQKYDQLGKYNDQIAAQKAAIEEMSQRYKDKYPAMIEAHALLQSLQDNFDAEMTRIVRNDQDNGLKPAVVIDPAVGITDDLRRPRLHAIFGADRKAVGLVDYFLEREELEMYVHPTSLPNLDLLLSGTRAPNPAELLSGKGFARLIVEALRHHDRVVVDTAPINAVSDTLMLIEYVDSICLVVRASSSPREAVLRAVRVLDGAGKRPVGTVFNRVPRRADLGYHRTYYYHYGVADRYDNAYAETPE